MAINDINKDLAESTAREIESLGMKSLAVVGDVSIRDQVFEMARQVNEHFGSLDVMVSNAGIAQVKPLLEVTEEDIQKSSM